MLDLNHLITSGRADVQVFSGGVPDYQLWNKPRGCSMLYILCVGPGSNGGNGAVGAVGAAAGGGGGGSGGQTTVLLPALFVPNTLFVMGGVPGVSASAVRVSSDSVTNNCIAVAFGPNAGGSASGVTAGTGAPSVTAATLPQMPLAGFGRYHMLAGQAGIAGNANSASSVTLPLTGLCVTGGAGGSGVPGSGDGLVGGSVIVATVFPAYRNIPGGAGGTSGASARGGSHGVPSIGGGIRLATGGAGGGSVVWPSQTAGNGGNGAPGCGGGGGGGAITGSTAGVGGKGGPGFVVIIAW